MHSHSLWLRPSPLCRPCGARWSVNFFYNDEIFIIEDLGEIDDHNAILMGLLYRILFLSSVAEGGHWPAKFASHYSSSLLPFAHNQTCPQSCVTHKTDFNPNVKASSSSYSSFSSFSSSSYPTTLAAYAPAVAHHGPLTIRQPITDFISFAKF